MQSKMNFMIYGGLQVPLEPLCVNCKKAFKVSDHIYNQDFIFFLSKHIQKGVIIE